MFKRRCYGGTRKSSSGQAPLLAAILFLILVPTSVILAENATVNLTGMITNASIPNTSLPAENATANIATVKTNSSMLSSLSSGNSTLNATFNITGIAAANEAAFIDETNRTSPGNATPETTNETLPQEDAGLPLNDTNTTLPEEEPPPGTASPENATLNETGQETADYNMTGGDAANDTKPARADSPDLAVSVHGPDRIFRGSDAVFSVEIVNKGNGTAFQVTGSWRMPDTGEETGFECGDVGPDEICTHELLLSTTVGTRTGIKEIGVVVRHA